MDKKFKEKNRLKIPKSVSRNKENKDSRQYSNLIPFNISNRNDNFLGREDIEKNTIFINDIETLNESSSFLNNLESYSIKECFKDSLSLVQSPKGLKIESNSQRNENEKFKTNNTQKLKDELVIKENENTLLKNEIKELKSNIKSMEDKESSYKSKILNLNENIKSIERESLNAKNEFQLKEKKLFEEAKRLKNEVKNKEKIIKMLQEKVINKSKIIKNLNDLINEKNLKINELSKKFEKNYQNHSRKNIDISTNINNKNSSFSGQNKENENYNKINSIKNYNNKLSIYRNSQKKMNLNQYLKEYKFSTKPKKKILFPKRENQSMTNIFQLNQIGHSDTYIDQGPPLYINNNSIKDFQKKLKKTINLKKQLINNKELFKLNQMRNKINTFENMNNSMKNKIIQNRNNLTHFSNNISFHSYSNKVAEFTSSPEFKENKKIINSCYINLIRERNQPDAFLRRLNKNNQKFIKTSFGDSTNSYINIEKTKSEKHNKKIINNSLENLSNSIKKKNSNGRNNIRNNNDNLFRINDQNKVNKFFKMRTSFNKELNNQNNEYIQSFSNEKKYS